MRLLKVLLLIVIIIAAGLFYLASNINDIVKEAIIKVGSETLTTSVTLDAVDMQLFDGRAQLSGLVVANTAGFSRPSLFEMDSIYIDFDIFSLVDRVIDLQEITIDGARITAEQQGGITNVQVLLENLRGSASAPAPAAEQAGADSVAGIELLIKIGQFNFVNSATNLVTQRWGEKQVAIPDIKLRNIGGEAGVSAEDLPGVMLKPLLKQLDNALKDRLQQLLKDEAMARAKEELKQREQELKQKMDKKLQEKLGDGAGDVVDIIKSLLSR